VGPEALEAKLAALLAAIAIVGYAIALLFSALMIGASRSFFADFAD
jgi:hypothetical protein